MSRRDEFTAKMKQQLDELNSKIDALEAKSQEAKADAREQYKAELVKVRRQSREAITKLEEVQAAGEDAWEKW